MQELKLTEITKDQVMLIAEKMHADGRYLIMIHGHAEADGTPVVFYDYDAGPLVDSYFVRGAQELPSISSIYDAAASWPEMELVELLGVNFVGLEQKDRLFLPDNLLEGKGHILVTPLSELVEKNVGGAGA